MKVDFLFLDEEIYLVCNSFGTYCSLSKTVKISLKLRLFALWLIRLISVVHILPNPVC